MSLSTTFQHNKTTILTVGIVTGVLLTGIGLAFHAKAATADSGTYKLLLDNLGTLVGHTGITLGVCSAIGLNTVKSGIGPQNKYEEQLGWFI